MSLPRTCSHQPAEHEPWLGCMAYYGTPNECLCVGDGSECGPAAKETETNEQAERYELDRGDA